MTTKKIPANLFLFFWFAGYGGTSPDPASDAVGAAAGQHPAATASNQCRIGYARGFTVP